MKKKFFIIFCFFVFYLFLFSEELQKFELPEFTVSVKKNEEKNSTIIFDDLKTSSFISFFSEKQINEKITLSELLEQLPGVQIKKYGGIEDYTAISIRGASSKQTIVSLDGFQLNSALYGDVNLSEIPLAQLDKIEVFRSGISSQNLQAMGGVVNLSTKKILKKNHYYFSSYFGSFNSYGFNANINHLFKNIPFLFNFSASSSAGDFKYKNNNNTEFNTDDDFFEKRKNNNSINYGFLLKTKIENNNNSFDFSNNLIIQEHGMPRLPVAQSSNPISNEAKLDTLKNFFSINYNNFHFKKNNILLTTKYINSFIKTRFTDKYKEISYVSTDAIDKFYIHSINHNIEYCFKTINQININFSGEFIKYIPEDKIINYPINYKSNRNNLAFALSGNINIYNSKLFFYPSFKYEKTNDKINDINFSTGNFQGSYSLSRYSSFYNFGWRYLFSENFSLKGNIGKAERIPTFYEMFGNRGFAYGNPNLISEKSSNFDFGINHNFKLFNKFNTFYEFVYFNNSYDNLILWLVHTNRIKPDNLSKAKIYGFEFFNYLFLSDNFWSEFSFTINESKNKTNTTYYFNKNLPNLPKFESWYNLNFKYYPFSFSLSYNFISKCFMDTINLKEVKKQNIFNFSLNYEQQKFNICFEIKNLTNEQINDNFNYPLPGQMYFLKLKFFL